MAKQENIYKKAYQCTYYKWWKVDCGIGGAYAVTVYAETPSKARYQFYLDLSEHYDKEIFMKIKVRRAKYQDLLMPERHSELDTLTESQISKMKHAVGVHSAQPFHRNYYQVENDEDWEDILQKGYAARNVAMDLPYYFLTKKGKELIRTLVPYKRGYAETN